MTRKKILIISILLIALASLAAIAFLYFSQTKKTAQKFVPKTNPNHKEAATLNLQALQLKRNLTKTGKKVGDLILKKTPDYEIDYLISNDEFSVGILKPGFTNIKQEATNWFLNQGFSKTDLCALNINFMTSKEIAESEKLNISNLKIPDCQSTVKQK